MTIHKQSLTSRAMLAVLSAQFLSALADNALLFAAIALLKSQAAASWQIPMLQEFFVVAFILLAPFVGPFADSYPKGRVMLIANTLKFSGAAAMLAGLNPLLSYGLVGIGAAAYSPAKYGILSELVNQDKLVKANGLMEGSTIVAILLGAVVGGKLADSALHIALMVVCGCYLAAALVNLLIPRLPAMRQKAGLSMRHLIQHFILALKTLFKNRDARLSLLGTSVFWGAGSTLRLLLVAWVPVALGTNDLSMPANLSGAVAIGIAVGAALAASFINLKNVNRVLPVGISIGLLIILFAHSTHLYIAIGLLIMIGGTGGFYVVPLNALLQERGHETVGAGNAVAVQNFFENCTMLTLIGVYIMLEKSGMPVVQAATIFGGIIFVAISLLALIRVRKHGRANQQTF
ncbi:lysophospholipid transporter LplT [mine drainage metagenome]|uniref:Lysophospholipid transporter LplT n=1 Tax=mine drainage metagenome TaxID=410659 RepID=A0A1J5S9F1_9ZZZZ